MQGALFVNYVIFYYQHELSKVIMCSVKGSPSFFVMIYFTGNNRFYFEFNQTLNIQLQLVEPFFRGEAILDNWSICCW